jgi:hypothetical protein
MQFVNHLYVTESDAAELVTVGNGLVDIKYGENGAKLMLIAKWSDSTHERLVSQYYNYRLILRQDTLLLLVLCILLDEESPLQR